MSTKAQWVAYYTDQKRFPGVREDVIQFIADILWHSGNEGTDPIYNLFANGYCYHFAVILRDIFGGQIVWHKNIGHILWYDGVKWCYDIGGVFEDISPDEMVPIGQMSDEDLDLFRHKPMYVVREIDLTKIKPGNAFKLPPRLAFSSAEY